MLTWSGKRIVASSTKVISFIFVHSLNVSIHIFSLALWVGGMGFFLFVFAPAAHSLAPRTGAQLLDQGRRSLQSLSWIAINILLITGVLNLIFRGAATGFQFAPVYYWILAIKLFLFLAMVFHHFLQVVKYAPKIVSLTAQATEKSESWPEPLLAHWKKWFMLLKINATLGLIVLLLGLGLTRS